MKPRFIAIIGPTASGKTALGIELAKVLDVPVISADSQLVYQGLTIGTGKPTPDETQGVEHRMIDIVSPTERYTVAQYRQQAKPMLEEIQGQGKIPIVVGGTGLYVRSLLDPPLSPDIPPNMEFREALLQWMEAQGPGDIGMQALHRRLTEKDPKRAQDIHFRNVVRVLRALEIIEATGKPVPEVREPNVNEVLWIGLTYDDRDKMRQSINRRIQSMLYAGWLLEVERLMGVYGRDAHALKIALGYPELVSVNQGQCSLEEAVSQIEINTHQYARRQLTWYRQNIFQQALPNRMHWFAVDTQPFDSIIEQAVTLVISSSNDSEGNSAPKMVERL